MILAAAQDPAQFFKTLSPGGMAALGGVLLLVLAAIGALVTLIVVTGIDILASPKLLLLRLSARSITSHRGKSLIVGGLLAGGTLLLVVGFTFILNTQRQMEQTITGGLVGHLQLYSDAAKDDLRFFGFDASRTQDLGVIPDFAKVKKAVEALPDVDAVIPMGRDIANAVGGNEFDERLGELRKAVEAKDQPKIAAGAARIRHMLDLLHSDIENRKQIVRDQAEIDSQLATVTHAQDPAFWADFAGNPLPVLDYLDTKVAQLQQDDAVFFLPYIGTDLDSFRSHFPRFQVDTDNGSRMIPSGQRGFLFSRQFYEEQAKNKVAFELDQIRKLMKEDRTTIAKDTDLQERVRKNITQYRRITYQLGPDDAALLERDLHTLLPDVKGGLDDLLKSFLDVNDQTFEQRYKFFYDEIAPRIRLYKVRIGDTITLRAYTKSGYTRAINLPVFGTFHFQGIDGSPVASRYNLMDLMSFRDLYGLMTPERKKELEAIKAQVGAKEVTREDAEAELFGSGSATAAAQERSTSSFGDPTRDQTVAARANARRDMTKPFTQEDIDTGVVLNAAVVLKPGHTTKAAMAAVNQVNEAQGLHIQVIDWETASGIVGQLIQVLDAALIVIIGIIFIVALVIINNSMVMATMDRVVEIGMMRAIGAHRRFVRAMYMLETTALAFVAALAGSLVATAIVLLFSKVGIRATADLLVIMFGGRWLYPTLEPASYVIGLVVIAVVSLVATFYPAFIATRIPPIVAMQRRE